MTESHGWATCRCVYPGITVGGMRFRLVEESLLNLSHRPYVVDASRSHRRRSVTTYRCATGRCVGACRPLRRVLRPPLDIHVYVLGSLTSERPASISLEIWKAALDRLESPRQILRRAACARERAMPDVVKRKSAVEGIEWCTA